MEINHNLELAKPRFIGFIKLIDKSLSQWIQYQGFELEGSQIYFKFKSSQNSLSFKIHGGVNLNDEHESLFLDSFNNIYNYFKEIKYENLTEFTPNGKPE